MNEYTRSLLNVDWDEEASVLGFSELHKVICGLSSKDLNAEAQARPEEINKLDCFGKSPLFYASCSGREDYILILLDHGSDPKLGASLKPISRAIYIEEYQGTKLLLDHGAEIDYLSGDGCTVLHRCIIDSDAYLFKFLVHHGASLDVKTRKGSTILHLIVRHAARLVVVKALGDLDSGAFDLDAKDDGGYTAFGLLKQRARLGWESFEDCFPSESFYHRYIRIIPENEHELVEALEALLRSIQESQDVPPEDKYPPLHTLTGFIEDDGTETEGSDQRTDHVPGAWPE